MDKPKLIRGDEWAIAFLKAMGLPTERNSRLIINCEPGRPIKIYLSYFGDDRIWDVQMPTMDIIQVEEPNNGDPHEMGKRYR